MIAIQSKRNWAKLLHYLVAGYVLMALNYRSDKSD